VHHGMSGLAHELAELGGADITAALEEVQVPSFVIDGEGVIRWLNDAARAEAGDGVGRTLAEVLPPAGLRQAQERLAHVLHSGEPAEVSVDLLDAAGHPVPREVSLAPLRDGDMVVGIFGVATPAKSLQVSSPTEDDTLTPRQLEILQLLAHGKSTSQIAEELYLSKTTVRNHVAHVLAKLGAHTRVQAIVAASRSGLIRMR
jgi:DNA-binding CsgD family transcriptional regulator